MRWLQKLLRFALLRYHYNLLIGEDGWHGGIMLAQGVGIDFRNLGGIYLSDGSFKRLEAIEIEYAEVETLAGRGLAHTVTFPKRWIVRAQAEEATLEYRGTRESPAAHIARDMIYFDFRFTGTYREPGKRERFLNGHGYGEYVEM
ncbi:MAG: hypothetical protein HYZ81_21505 [Nitrospinae bacterium]|nr:hypothetical protein [Nitrospinota bacterium]